MFDAKTLAVITALAGCAVRVDSDVRHGPVHLGEVSPTCPSVTDVAGVYHAPAMTFEGAGGCEAIAADLAAEARPRSFEMVFDASAGWFEMKDLERPDGPTAHWDSQTNACRLELDELQASALTGVHNVAGTRIDVTSFIATATPEDGRLSFGQLMDLDTNPPGLNGFPCRITGRTVATKE